MRWILENFQLIIFLAIAFSFVKKVRAFWKRAASETEERARSRRPIASYDPDEVRRVQEIQDEIRRKIAERRGGAHPVAGSSTAETRDVPPPILPRQPSPIDPFGGPTRRILGELERRLQPAPVQVTVSRRAEVAAEVTRQEEIAEQMRVLEETRFAAERRAREARANLRSDSQSERKLLAASRDSLLVELKDPASLRRAFVLREVLGPPVGLR
jgi:hypothetical protein